MTKLTKAAESVLGTVPDAKVAEATGMDKSSITHARKKRGIPPADPSKSGKYVWDEHAHLLGTMPDTSLAAQLGLAQSAVTQARQRRGIPPYVEPQQAGTPSKEAVRTAREAAGQSQAEAAALVHLGHVSRWSEYERGIRDMDVARWQLYLLLTGQHPTLRAVPK